MIAVAGREGIPRSMESSMEQPSDSYNHQLGVFAVMWVIMEVMGVVVVVAGFVVLIGEYGFHFHNP